MDSCMNLLPRSQDKLVHLPALVLLRRPLWAVIFPLLPFSKVMQFTFYPRNAVITNMTRPQRKKYLLEQRSCSLSGLLQTLSHQFRSSKLSPLQTCLTAHSIQYLLSIAGDKIPLVISYLFSFFSPHQVPGWKLDSEMTQSQTPPSKNLYSR